MSTNETLKPFQQQYINSTLFTAIQNAGSVLATAGVAVAADAGSLVSSTSLYTAGTLLTTDLTAQAGSIAVAAEQVISLVAMMGSVFVGSE